MLSAITLTLTLAAANAVVNDPAPAPEPVLPHRTFTLDSEALGETRRINVNTPPGYDEAEGARYPVLYMPDGGVAEDFPHVTTDVDAAVRAGEMRPVIVVVLRAQARPAAQHDLSRRLARGVPQALPSRDEDRALTPAGPAGAAVDAGRRTR